MATGLWTASDFAQRALPRPTPGASVDFFSTVGLVEPDRVERWEQHNERALVSLSCRGLNDNPLDARELTLRLPQLTFAEVAANPHVVERTKQQIDRTSSDGVALYFSLFGEAFFYHEAGVLIQRPGTLLVTDLSRPFMRGFAQGLEEYVLTVPRGLFETVAARALPKSPITLSFADVPGGDAAAAELARLVRGSLAAPDASAGARETTEESALGLLRAMFSTDAAHSASSYRRAALAYIDRHLRDAGLSVTRVAEAVGVSERHLARVFAETGTGVARTILERRLELAHHLLSRRSDLPVSEVAGFCGFASAAHFARVFRERYEVTPAEARRHL